MKRLKLFLSLLMLFSICVGNVWATDASVTLSSGSFATDHITWTVADGNIAISQLKGSSSTAVNSSYISAPRVYKGHVLSFVASNGYKINSIEITVSTTYYGNSMTAGTVMSGNTVTDNTTDVSRTWTTTSGGKHVVSAVADEGLSVIYIQNVASASNVQLRISALKITYTVPTSSDVIVKTLKSIAVSGQTTEYDQNDIFSFDGTCTATYSVTKNNVAQEDEEKVVTPTSVSSPDMTTIGEKEVTVSFTDGDVTKTAKYNITVNEHVVNPGEYTINLNNTLFGTSVNFNITSAVNAKQDDISLVVNGTGSTKPRMDASYVRFYGSSSLTLSVPAGYNITKIVYAYGSNKSDEQGVPTANVGTIDSSNKQWTGKANEVVLSFSAKSFIASVTVTYAAIAPEVTVDPASLSFTAKQNIAVEGKKFTLTGANLTSGLSLAASTGFSVSPTSLTAEAAMVEGGVEVTVTPATPTATTTPVEGTVTISGGGLASNVVVNLSMAVTPTYLVGIAVNSNTMGSATINGGTAAVYVTADDEIALVATPAEHHEFVNWTVSDENIIFNNANAASTTALAGAAGTITANFQQQACQALAAPTKEENNVATTYQSATIAWNAVSNAEGYVLNVIKHDGADAVVTDEVIVAPAVSFEIASGLAANTQYDYTVMAIGDGTIYCDASNPVLESSFTTNDYPAATLSLVENGGEAYNWGSGLKLNSVIALPEELDGLGCSGKVLVGWTNDENFADTDDEPTSNYWAKGADYTIASTADKLYAVLATQTGGGANDVVFNAGNYATANNWENSKAYTSFTIDGITFTAIGGGNNGKYYTSDKSWRFYNGGSLSISGTGITGVSSTPSVSFTNNNGTYSASFSATKQFTSIVVSVSSPATFEAYTTSCTAALPKLDAPEFDLAAGSYYDALQTVTLTATNSADIYYTLDGTDPTTASTKYTDAISLSARQEYTIKAIAIKEGFESSEIATREYNIVLPYDFATFAALEKVNGKEYAVRGIISEKGDYNSNYKELAYFISANGQKAGQIKCHNGLKLNKATFTSADDVNLGDNVTVVGTWSTQYSNLNAGNWMLEYTARVHDTYTIEGALTASSFDDGDAFDDAILANLTMKETFTNGYYENVAGVTFNAGEKTAWADGDTKLTVNAVLNEAVIATKDFDVVVTSAQLVSIALKADDENYSTKIVYYIGETFVAPTIVATLNDESVYDAEATYVSGFDNANAGVQEVTISYTRGTVTETTSYSITMKAIFNNEDAPHTVAEANALINAHGTTSASSEYMWVRGIVAGFKGTSDNQYYISDDGTAAGQLYVYNGKSFNNVTMTAANKPAVGDVVILKTKMQIYSNAPELSGSVVVYQLSEPEFAIADIVAADEFEANVSEDMAVVPTANSGDVEFTLTSGDEAVVTIVEGKLHAVAEGDAEITASRAATANENALNYKAKEITFIVHVIAERTRYTITFDANGGEGTDPEAIANQLAGATVELPETNPYSKEGYGFTAWIVSYDETEEEKALGESFTMPEANVTITPKWVEVATCAISFIAKGVTIATVNADQDKDYPITQVGTAVSGFAFAGWSETEENDEVLVRPTLIGTYHPQAGEETKTLYAIYSRVDKGVNYGKYVKATEIAEGDYLIVCENQNVAFDGSLEELDAAGNNQAVTIADGVLTLANADNYVVTLAAVTGGYTIKTKSGYYLGGKGSGTNGMNCSASTEYTNTVTISNGDAEIIGNGAYMRCNPNSDNQWFRYFKASTYTSQKAIQLYKKDLGSVYYTSNPGEIIPSVAIAEKGGMFAIGEGKKVIFSRGNLRYNYGKDKWYCAENQYDVLENANLNFGKEGYEGSIDLFSWSNAVSNYGRLLSNKDADYPGYNDFVDWGQLFANDAKEWSTLSKDEWNYLQNHNNWTMINLIDAEAVNEEDVFYAMVLFPENWVAPAGLENLNYKFYNFDDEPKAEQNTITVAQWNSLFEPNGAVLLPAAGSRAGYWGNMIGKDGVSTATTGLLPNGQNYDHVDNVGWYGYYWLTTQDTREDYKHCASYLILPAWSEGPTLADEDDEYRAPAVWSREKRRGNSVRLVTRLYNVTYNAGGAEGVAPVDANVYRPGDVFMVKAPTDLTKEGYEFQGWYNGNKLYKAGKTFKMPADAVTLTAKWRKLNVTTDKMMLITKESDLANGIELTLGCSYGESSFAMAGDITGTNKYMNSVSGTGISLDGNIASFTENVVTLIAEQVEGGWTLRKDETHYLTLTGADVKWDAQANATVWTISFSNGNVQIASGNNKIQFNSNNPRFKTYTSNQTPIQLFGKVTVVKSDEPVNISDLGHVEGEPLVVASGTTLVGDEPSAPKGIVVEQGARYEAEAETTTPTVTFSVTMGSNNPNGDPTIASEIGTPANIILTTGGEITYDITLGTSLAGVQADPNQWHAFTVPFPCDALNGIYNAETGEKLANEVDYAIMDYHGDIRANGQYGWKKYRGILQPGTFYIVTIEDGISTLRFKLNTSGNLPTAAGMAYAQNSGTGAEGDQGWNGIGNPTWEGVTLPYDVQILDPYSYEYVTVTAGTNIPVSTPVFYKASEDGTMNMTPTVNPSASAPKRVVVDEIHKMAVSFGNEVYKDKFYVTASEDALNSYEQDKDLVKMRMSNTPKVAQIFGDAYGMKLSMVNTPLVNDNAEVALTLYAPAAGEYTISIAKTTNATVYLVRDGRIIWNLSESDYTTTFEKGDNTNYGLRLVAAPQVPTDIENVQGDHAQCTKVIIDEHVYILRGEKMYDVTGKMLR